MEDTTPFLIVITHFINLFCIILLIRSGLRILSDHPLLYWTDSTKRDNYWLKFGKKKMPTDKLWTSHDETEPIGQYALPGGKDKGFGMARNWHLMAAVVWVVTGMIYWGYMFMSGQWTRLIPTSWSIFPEALQTQINYLTLHVPPESAFHPYDPMQQLVYAVVVFVIAPMMILTALAMSPAFTNRFPRYLLLFGGRRQAARSLHFIGMLLISGFIIIHVLMVSLVYFSRNIRLITFGTTDVNLSAALIVFLSALLFILIFNILASYLTINHRVGVRKVLITILHPIIHGVFGRLAPRSEYNKEDISEFFRVNGYPPDTEEFNKLQKQDFKNWRLKVNGLVTNELSLSLNDIKKLPYQDQITKHICIQGWSAIGQWGGIHMREIIKLAKPNKNAKYIVFHAYDVDGDNQPFYEALRVTDMRDSQTILAYEMNWKPLTAEHGAPLRLRCERKLGFKMVKYIKSIEFVDSYKQIGRGRGGYREDNVMYDWEASI